MKNMFTFVLLKERKQISRWAAAKPPERRINMKKEIATKIYSDVFGTKLDEGKNINSWLKAVIVNFGDERGDILVKGANMPILQTANANQGFIRCK